jgi:hypothetical protein
MSSWGILIFIIILYIYYIQVRKLICAKSEINYMLRNNQFKTGDIILFKATNNYNAIAMGCYFTHIGVVYVDNGVPFIFEACAVKNVNLLNHHSKDGIYLTPLKERIEKYKGVCYLKPLNKQVDAESIDQLSSFINYALKNMYYDYNVFGSALKKGVGLERCQNGTNCGQITFLSLISMGLLPHYLYDTNIFHHLAYSCYIVNLDKGYKYNDIIEITDHPFGC